MLALLFSEPWIFVAWFIAFLGSLAVHEASHAAVATWLGDQTAKRMGRLTLNPAAHVDTTGLLFTVLAGFGWGKPVPFNPYNLRWPKWGPVAVAFAGPTSNLLLAFLGLLALAWALPALGTGSLLTVFFLLFTQLNLALLAFNLIPLPPLDGSKLLLAALAHPRHAVARMWIETKGPMVLLGLVLADTLLGLGLFSWVFSAVSGLVLRIAGALGIFSA